MKKEIIIICGIQGGGKSTLVKEYVDKGYIRLNRDEMGGKLDSLNKKLEDLIAQGKTQFVLDNTYGPRDTRKPVIDIGKKNGFEVNCIFVNTKIEDAQYNVVGRIIDNFVFGSEHKLSDIFGPDGGKFAKGIGYVPSIALYSYKKSFVKPSTEEGFDSVQEIPFKRKPLSTVYQNKAIIFDYDGTLRETKSGRKFPITPDDIRILPNRKETLMKYLELGYIPLGVSNQSGVEKGEFTNEAAKACFDQTNKLLGVPIDVLYCPHHSFPIRCYCRKPLPAFGVYFIKKYLLKPSECIFVGDSTSDSTFAARCGFQFQSPEEFFK